MLFSKIKRFLSKKIGSILIQHSNVYGKYFWNPSDIYIVAYPKSGITYLSLMLANIKAYLEKFNYRIDYYIYPKFIPDLHATPDLIPMISSPRVIKSHEYFEELIERVNVKGRGSIFPRVIYLVRDGRDIMISYYHYVKGIYGWDGDFGTFLNDKKIKKWEWEKHIRGWLMNDEVKDILDKKLLVVKYEDLKNHTVENLRRICDFIGFEKIDDNIINLAIEKSDIRKIQEYERLFGAPRVRSAANFMFARKGTSENWKAEFNEELIQFYRNKEDVFKLLGYTFE
jgi:hypothetical protein